MILLIILCSKIIFWQNVGSKCDDIDKIVFKNDVLTKCLLKDAMKLQTICSKIIIIQKVFDQYVTTLCFKIIFWQNVDIDT